MLGFQVRLKNLWHNYVVNNESIIFRTDSYVILSIDMLNKCSKPSFQLSHLFILKAFLRKTERDMVGAMCGQKVVDRKTTKEQMDMLGNHRFKKIIDRFATENGVRW